MNDIQSLAEAIAKANAAAERLVRCAESISNPVYSVVMQGHSGELQIQAVRHFQGQIILTVADPYTVDAEQRRALSRQPLTLKSPELKQILKDANDDGSFNV